ncbi:alpha/beta hydrolase family protein [Dokdonella fugitiva]|jgi:predicted alpha/beta hydrolase|uniref:Putative alpha/beta hydrolase n=1 Tax=Dokdonella fugitiva TaxID=328517 RepID=A0A4R2HUB0_9GAMM|nr:putative alpha/beta hydrolase [Dokdonella fugitiva]
MADDAGEGVRESVATVVARDGARAELAWIEPAQPPRSVLLWLPALGVSARNYLPFARGLAAHGMAVALHEWRGAGSSDRRAGRGSDWGYRELLLEDIPASRAVVRERHAGARMRIGGHSLGGQLAVLAAALDPGDVAGVVLVASGSPYWRCFAHPWLLRAFYTGVPALAAACGYFPGRRLGFGGREARRVMTDWARSGRSGRYSAAGVADDLEARLARVTAPVFALRFADDWFGPEASLEWLLRKLPAAPRETVSMDSGELGNIAADHFSWMKSPAAVIRAVANKCI